MSMIQVGALGVAGALLAIQFKSGKAEYGIYISIALSILIFFAILSPLKIIIKAIQTIGTYINMDSAYIGTLLKMLGITYIAEFSSNICKDAGYQTIAGQIEVFGKLLILALGTPILLTLLDTIKGFLS
ncbi:MAG: stage III sporulation protein AD [Lachnospiraceae bacterium]